MKLFHQLKSWLVYQWKAGTKHDVHSPFVFNLYTQVIASENNPVSYAPVELLRKKLESDAREIQVRDFGSAERGATYSRTIASIASSSAKAPRIAALLGRLAGHFKPTTVLDLGTSLGITTAYLASSAPFAEVHTLEGCPETKKVAASNMQQLNITNVVLHEGEIGTLLPHVLKEVKSLDLVFFDANHQYEPTLQYFDICREKVHNDSVFIFDDIYWSEGMTRAWKEICKHPSVTVSVDLFHVGLIFFRKEQVRQHFCLRF